MIDAKKNRKSTVILLMHCPDCKGIVAKVTEFIDNNNGNIISLDEHVDRSSNIFFMRVEWELMGFLIPPEKISDYFGTQIAAKYGMKWDIYFTDKAPRMALFVSKLSHCMYDILARYNSNEWDVEIPLIISNHPDLADVAGQFKIPFHVFPINEQNKVAQEAKEIELLRSNDINFVVLARYMQVISDSFIRQYSNRIINIHHSFLPAFPGAKPYHSAFERGVKIIGATSHYVTAELDAGPIIDQGVARISHRDSVEKLIMKGKDTEKLVLAQAILLHIQRRTLVYNNRTVIFD
jgi:formyltetrahydrofolate deformylase